MPRISVLLPTHDRASTLPYAVRSVQTQGVDDLEILICGDGVNDELRAVIAELRRADPRIRFFDLPKAPGLGELNCDHVLRQATGQIICHHNDDDLWLPGHIEVLERALENADFVGAMQVNVGTDGKVRAHYFDLERPEFLEPWLDWKPNNFGPWACNGFSPPFVAHRLDAFLRLPEGWITTPAGLPVDQTLWHRFLRQPWCRTKFLRWPIALAFPSPDRHDWTPQQRAEELRHWTQIIESPEYAVRIWRDVLPDLGDRLLRQSLRGPLSEVMAEHEAALARERAEKDAFIVRMKDLEAEVAAVRSAAADRIRELDSVLSAEKVAAVARIRELEIQVDAIAEAAAAQAIELQTRADAERSAAADRIRSATGRIPELEMIVTAHEAALTRERTLRAEAESERNAMLSSTFWRMTAPMRRAVNWLRRLRPGQLGFGS